MYKKQLEEQLEKNEQQGVIKRVDKPTPWVSPELVEGNGYESWQTSKWYVIVMILAWSCDVKPAHTFKTRWSFKRHERRK